MKKLIQKYCLAFFLTFIAFKLFCQQADLKNIDSLVSANFLILEIFDSTEFSVEKPDMMLLETEKRNIAVEFFSNISCITPEYDHRFGFTLRVDGVLIEKWKKWYQMNRHNLTIHKDFQRITPHLVYEVLDFYKNYPFHVRLKNVKTTIPYCPLSRP